jgi:hypothetical protein
MRIRAICAALLSLPAVAGWTAAPRNAGARAPTFASIATRAPPPRCFDDDRFDRLVLYGDAGVLVGYGVIQTLVDTALMPLASSQPEMFTQDQPVLVATFQGVVIAALWVGITLALDGYRAGATRSLPSSESLVPLVGAWLGSSAVLLGVFVAAGLPLEAEAEFVFGSATVIGGWRFLYSRNLPLL